jgi:hypothetical protein
MSGAHLVQLLLPIHANDGGRFAASLYRDVARELTGRFGGVTAYSRAPAQGLWEEETGRTERDDVVVYEVMVESLDRAWWRDYRRQLEERFAQDELVVRALPMGRL